MGDKEYFESFESEKDLDRLLEIESNMKNEKEVLKLFDESESW